LQDEFDQERALITPAGEGRIVVRGDMLIANLNDLLEISLPYGEAYTIGGLVMTALGRVPQIGDTVKVEGIQFRVEAVAHRSVAAVCVALPPDADSLGPKEVAR
jgi:Mg2+/Co2+ transporter CorC